MAEEVNRRRKFVIRVRVSRREKQVLLERKRAIGSRTWREFMEGVAASRPATGVDLRDVAQLAAVVVSLSEGPRQMRLATQSLGNAIERLGELMLQNPERADMHRRGLELLIRECQEAARAVVVVSERAELEAAPARSEVARVMRMVTGK